MKTYKVTYGEEAANALRKMDGSIRRRVLTWVDKNLEGTSNAREHGRGLSENLSGLWRYRIGKYRLIADILDDEVIINIIKIGHRANIYDN